MNAKEKAVVEKWNMRNTVNKELATAAFNDLCDFGAEVDPRHNRWCSLDAAIEQVLDYGTREDILAAINKVSNYRYLSGKYDSMMNLLTKL